MQYNNPLDITQVINDKHISGICNTIINEFIRVCKNNSDTKVVPMIKNEDYGFYMVDYGFLVYSIETYIKNYYKIMKKEETKGIELAEKIHRDFANNSENMLTKNGQFLISTLKYFGVCFENKKNKLYLRTLFLDKKNDKHLLIHSISLNLDKLLEHSGRGKDEEEIIKNSNTLFEYIAIERAANNRLKILGERVELFQFWSREDGYNKLLID